MAHYGEEMEPPPQKSSGWKIVLLILGICAGVFVLACGGCLVGSIWLFKSSISEDPATVRQTAQSITEIDLPEGYEPLFSMNMFGLRMAGFGERTSGRGRVLMLMAFPSSMAADRQQMRQQMDQSLQQQTGHHEFRQIESEQRTYTIRGEECQVQIAKVQTDDGSNMRQVTAIFTAKNNMPAMLMVMMPEEEWMEGGEASLEAMFASMK